jgi:pyrroloquinoline quinone biosynthesis protein B
MKFPDLFLFLSLFISGKQSAGPGNILPVSTETSLIILGTVQDAGSPQIGCKKDCCKTLFLHPDKERKVVCLGLLDHKNNKRWLFEATPDLPAQMKMLTAYSPASVKETADGIFLTHAHIGHYTGLMYLGKEAMNADRLPVYAMPGMKKFLEQNGPWSQLVSNNNIAIQEMNNEKEIQLSSDLIVFPFLVPHRDEFSETVGYRIIGPHKKAIFIPDIDKWQKWKTDIKEAIAKVDYAFIDGTFYDAAEINNRDISEIPHPFIIESMNLLKDLPAAEKKKIHFIHFNHTNPALNKKSKQAEQVMTNGFNIAGINDVFNL